MVVNMLLKLILLLFIATSLYAAQGNNRNWTINAPPTDGDVKAHYDFSNALYTHFNQLQVTTTNPNGNNFASFGDMLLYQATGSTYYFTVQTTSPSGSTWLGVKLGVF